MKVVSEGTASLLGGVDAPINMGISTDPEDQLMILNVLSNSLYTDKIAAVLREYGCNAFDANVEAGRGHQPIEVRLPNRLDPTLAIRDFGYGMNETQILTVFCRLGRSTKRQSNAFTGMLGIGSKAGFAYGDSFVVTSFCDGTKTVYNCFRDQGAPRLAKMHDEPTDSPDGIEVKVPIRSGDFNEFITKAERIFRYFKVRPIIHGAHIDWKERGVAEFSGNGWRYTGVNESVAIMGNVGYTLSEASLPATVDGRIRTLIMLGCELDFEIGDLEVAANREGLQYKDHTIKSIVSRLKIVADEVTKVFTDRIAKASTLWEACRLYADNFEKMGTNRYGVRTLKEVVNQGLVWQGRKITTGRFSLMPASCTAAGYPGLHIVEYHKDRQWNSRISKRENPHDTYSSEKTVLCINDLPSRSNSPSRVKGFFETHVTSERLVTFTFESQKIQDKYWKDCGLTGAPTVTLSSIAPSISVSSSGGSGSSGPSAHRAKHSAKVFELSKLRPTNNSRVASTWWERTEVDLENDSGIYVKISKFKAILKDGEHDPNLFHADVASLSAAGIIKGRLFGFKPEMALKVGKGWVSLEDHIAANLAKWVAANKQAIADADAALAHKEWIKKEWARHFKPNSAMHQYLRSFELMVQNGKAPRDMVDSIRRGYNCLLDKQVLAKLPKPTHDLDALSKQALDTYPLLAIINDRTPYTWDDPRCKSLLQSAVNYVSMIGK